LFFSIKHSLFFFFLLLLIGQAFAKAPGSEPKDTLVVIGTRLGEITVVLFPETPLHRSNFLRLAGSKAYDSTTFHRIIKDFMIQGGDPNSKDNIPENDGMGSYGNTIPAEFNPAFTHMQGALAAARTNNAEKRSSDCQFYLVENPAGTHFLNNEYTVYGQVVKGIEVVQAIALEQKGPDDKPLSNVRMWMKLLPLKREKVATTYGYDCLTHRVKPELIKDK
jgi:cyclophilin family peptidyl-prolyl cis-trans isomerase